MMRWEDVVYACCSLRMRRLPLSSLVPVAVTTYGMLTSPDPALISLAGLSAPLTVAMLRVCNLGIGQRHICGGLYRRMSWTVSPIAKPVELENIIVCHLDRQRVQCHTPTSPSSKPSGIDQTVRTQWQPRLCRVSTLTLKLSPPSQLPTRIHFPPCRGSGYLFISFAPMIRLPGVSSRIGSGLRVIRWPVSSSWHVLLCVSMSVGGIPSSNAAMGAMPNSQTSSPQLSHMR